jgi:kynurenine formamidase
MHSGWDHKAVGAGFRNADTEGKMHFPGFHVEAAQMLIEDTGAVAIAVDTLSLDHGPSADFATHYAWLPTNRYGIECLKGLDQMPATGATLVVGAPTHRGGSGGPARIFGMI